MVNYKLPYNTWIKTLVRHLKNNFDLIIYRIAYIQYVCVYGNIVKNIYILLYNLWLKGVFT